MYHVTYAPCNGDVTPLRTRECDSLTDCIKWLLFAQMKSPECYDNNDMRFCITSRDNIIANNLIGV